jgi:purine-nucleoside phosphorylase
MTNQDWFNAIGEATDFLRPYSAGDRSIGIVLGTGLGALVRHMDIAHTVAYSDIPHFPAATVEFHKGQLLFGRVADKEVIAMQGRYHYYEGYSMQEVTFPIRVMKALGCSHLLLSNAAGGINATYRKGDLVLIDDHINLQTDNPLRGLNDAQFGQRFVDMSAPYDAGLSQIVREVASHQDLHLHTGIYAAVTGPNLETRAEYRFLRTIGADLVGMSTVPEVIVANQVGLPCAAVSVVTDECDPDNLQPVNIAEIIEAAGKADQKLSALLADVIGMIK